ncbi:MAG: hypothetical protein NTV80_09285 [Verrucomicrobia bacterium]|nr:hypothetical protein [Verrucomicrobiota bacterium]
MQYLLLPAIITVIAAVIAVSLLAVRRSLLSARVFSAVLALLISHGVVGLAVFIYKDLDDNSYYAASTQILLDETVAAIDQQERNFLNRLKEFVATQSLTYEDRGNLLEHARTFAARGEALRTEFKPK